VKRALPALAAGAIMVFSIGAYAATFAVEDSVLSVTTRNADIPWPPPTDEEYRLEVEVWRMDGNSGKREGIDAYPYRYHIPTGEPYLITWSDGDHARACHRAGSSHSAPSDPFGFDGPRADGYFEPGSDLVHHVVCVQRGAAGEPVVSIATGEVSPESAPDGADLSTSLAVKASEENGELAISADAAASEPNDEEHINPDTDPAGAE
jgi:hypothetical protein